jgi:excisionase family DNA binding protein
MEVNAPERHYLTYREAAEKLRVSPSTIGRLVRAGLLPAVRIGTAKNSAVRIASDELDQFLYADPEDAA